MKKIFLIFVSGSDSEPGVFLSKVFATHKLARLYCSYLSKYSTGRKYSIVKSDLFFESSYVKDFML